MSLELPPEADILRARLPFDDAQYELESGLPTRVPELLECGWYGSNTISTRGSFALVRSGTDAEFDLVGEVLRVSYEIRSVLVLCVATARLPTALALSRRAFTALAVPQRESILVTVEKLA